MRTRRYPSSPLSFALTFAGVVAACGRDETEDTPWVGACVEDCSNLGTSSCAEPRCNPATGLCELVPRSDGDTCDDELFCTVNDHCERGQCTGDPNDCGLAALTCKAAACSEQARSCHYVNQPNGAACASADICSLGGTCAEGVCAPTPKTCRFEPSPECQIAQCNPDTGACDVFVPVDDDAPCEFDDPCLSGKHCKGGVCQGGTPRECN